MPADAGESAARKNARAAFWSYLVTTRGKHFQQGKHLTLVDRAGGEVATLCGLTGGFKGAVTGLTTDPELAYQVQERLPESRIIVSELLPFIKKRPRSFDSVMLVQDRPLDEALFDTFIEVMKHGVRDGGIIGVAYTYGDKANETHQDLVGPPVPLLGVPYEQLKEMSDDAIMDLFFQKTMGIQVVSHATREVLNTMKGKEGEISTEELHRVTDAIPSDARIYEMAKPLARRQQLLLRSVAKRCVDKPFGLTPLDSYACVSRVGEEPEMPLVYTAFLISRCHPGEDVHSFKRRHAKELLRESKFETTTVETTEADLKRHVRDAMDEHFKHEPDKMAFYIGMYACLYNVFDQYTEST